MEWFRVAFKLSLGFGFFFPPLSLFWILRKARGEADDGHGQEGVLVVVLTCFPCVVWDEIQEKFAPGRLFGSLVGIGEHLLAWLCEVQ